VKTAEAGPMKLFLCDVALDRARLSFARIEAFAPLHVLINGQPAPVKPGDAEIAQLLEKAGEQLDTAAEYIQNCGYHRRKDELAELRAVLAGERKFADLPPRV
jgi:hypothetical protein